MALDIKELETLLKDRFPSAKIEIQDLRGDGDHYSASVECEEFREKSRIQQHQMVYEALKGKMGTQLHALAVKTSVPSL